MKHLKVVWSLCLAVMMSCATSDSEDIKTSGVRATITVTSETDDTTDIKVQLTVGSGFGATDLDLNQGDQLVAEANNTRQKLGPTNSLGDIIYSTRYEFGPNVTISGMRFNIAFERTFDTDAPSSYVDMPDVFSITPLNPSYAVDENISVTWRPANSNMTISGHAQCQSNSKPSSVLSIYLLNSANIVDRLGSTTFNFKELMSHDNIDKSQPCNGTITLSSTNKGHLDPNYGEGGSILAIQTRKVNFSLTFSTATQ